MRRWWLVAIAVVLLPFVVRGCRHGERLAPGDAPDRPSALAGPDATSSSTSTGPPGAAADAATAQALTDASVVLHRYLQAAGAARWKEADALWAYRRVPNPEDEDGFRSHTPVRALKIRNQLPVPLDELSPPSRVRVPVRLDMNSLDKATYHYTGDYVLRRNDVTRRWELVSASLKAVDTAR